jgi:hypothetical protein
MQDRRTSTWAKEGQPSMILKTPAKPSRTHRLSEAVRYFLWLGTTGFGSPVATRLNLPAFVVSNGSRPIRPPGLPNVQMVIVGATLDAAVQAARRVATG